jgi:mannose-6-phosphate isomerase-like protein (cupin superfamily)
MGTVLLEHHNIKKQKTMEKGYVNDIEALTLANDNFREVVYTGPHSQLVLMALKPKEEIGMEVHPDNDQFFRFEKGLGKVIIDGNEYDVEDGFAVVVPAGAQHNVIDVSDDEDLKLYTIYSPAHHKDGIIRATKEEAAANEEEFDGKTTE